INTALPWPSPACACSTIDIWNPMLRLAKASRGGWFLSLFLKYKLGVMEYENIGSRRRWPRACHYQKTERE
ncbi:MAG: hypothetical protein IJN82_00255, partial [Clostridia bacterium]|nr:hypothetical protein [Clostridia bacterium]